jgi:cyclophilin family peptidyl-prolyl cis-trans isomerase
MSLILFERVFWLKSLSMAFTALSLVPSMPTIGNDNVNYNGTIAMANTGQPNSASSQFFINVADNQNLYPSFDTSYTVFGQVIQGMNVVMAISNVPVNPSTDQPLQNVTLIKAEVLP